MKVLFSLLASAVAISLYLPAEASKAKPADIETLDQIWQQYDIPCRQGDQNACLLRDQYHMTIKQNFPNAVRAMCPPDMKRTWFETGRKAMAAGCMLP
ncbi:MAG: hypothetical protein HF560_00190 [Synechococcus sp. MIT S9220]|uniref:hypothetical protein n=1 Tax=unclassified Synechococcus TaxID=2626047 RepID=UPI00164AA0DE|nr:hypothetical protein [Synechococcus sp. MIT S9220]NOL45983.1 hypothetical protein [Synechococcus sp. MIT S9220]